MNVALWIIQGLLAAMFAMAGLMKLSAPVEKLREKMPWVDQTGLGQVRFAGAAEVAGAVGLVLPQALGVAPILTPLAAVGLALIMILAMRLHAARGETSSVIVNAVLGALALAIAAGRFFGA